MELAEIEARCRELAYQGVEYEQIRKELEQFELPAEGRRQLLEKTDGFIVQYQLHEQYRNKALMQMLLGGVVLAAGLATLIGAWLSGGGRLSFPLAIALAGAWALRKGNEKYRAPIGSYEMRSPKKKIQIPPFLSYCPAGAYPSGGLGCSIRGTQSEEHVPHRQKRRTRCAGAGRPEHPQRRRQ